MFFLLLYSVWNLEHVIYKRLQLSRAFTENPNKSNKMGKKKLHPKRVENGRITDFKLWFVFFLKMLLFSNFQIDTIVQKSGVSEI